MIVLTLTSNNMLSGNGYNRHYGFAPQEEQYLCLTIKYDVYRRFWGFFFSIFLSGWLVGFFL